jgi:hypothetical protein
VSNGITTGSSVVIAVCFATAGATTSSAKSIYQHAKKWSPVAAVVPTAVIIAYTDNKFGMLVKETGAGILEKVSKMDALAKAVELLRKR